jgi:hypothetical protein
MQYEEKPEGMFCNKNGSFLHMKDINTNFENSTHFHPKIMATYYNNVKKFRFCK